MAAAGSKLATGWLELTVSTAGAQQSMTSSVMPSALSAGDAAGAALGGTMLGSLKKALPAAAIGAAIVGVGKGLFSIGSTFDEVSDTIRVGTGATGANLLALESVAKQVGTSVPTSFQAAGSVVADLNTRMGLTGGTLKTVASQYLEAGRILGETVDVNTTTAAFNAFGVSGDRVSGAMDTLFRVSQATGVGMNSLAGTVQTAAPLVQNLGFSFEDTASLVGTLDKAGLNATKMLATLGPGLVKMAKDGEQPADVFPRVVGQLNDLVAAGDTAGAINLAGGIFGTRGAAQFVAAIQSGALNLADLQGAVGATSDTILGVAKDTADAAEQWQILKNRAVAALQPIGALLFNGLGTGLSLVNSLLDQASSSGFFSDLAASVGPLAGQMLTLWQSLSPVSLVFQALSPLLPQIVGLVTQLASLVGGVLQQAFTVVLPPVTELAGVLVGVLSQVFAALMPALSLVVGLLSSLFPVVTPLITAVLGLVGPIVSLISPIVQLVGALLPPLISLFIAILTPILGLIQPILGLLVPALQFVVSVLTTVVQWVATAITWFVNFVTGQQEAGQQFQSVWSAVMSFFGGVGQFFANIWNGLISGIANFVGSVVGFFASIPDQIRGVFVGAATWLYNVGRDIVNGLLNGVGSLLSGIGEFFLSLVPDWILGPFKAALGINSPSRVFREFGVYTMQGYVEGVESQQVTTSAMLARAVAIPKISSTASTASAATVAASSTGDTITFTGVTTDTAAEEIAAAIEKKKRRRVKPRLVTAGVS